MTINLDSEVVATRYDSATGECFYTIERGGKRWTARVHLDDLNKHGPVAAAGQQRRNYLAGALEEAMRGPPDGEVAISDISGAQPAQMYAPDAEARRLSEEGASKLAQDPKAAPEVPAASQAPHPQ